MNLDLVLGLFAIAFGLYTLVLRFTNPAALGKLEPMKQRFGEHAGMAIHVVAYTLVPLVAGATWLLAGLAAE